MDKIILIPDQLNKKSKHLPGIILRHLLARILLLYSSLYVVAENNTGIAPVYFAYQLRLSESGYGDTSKEFSAYQERINSMPQVEPFAPAVFEVNTNSIDITASVGANPINIIKTTQGFSVTLEFEGVNGGVLWEIMKSNAEPFSIRYFAESMGPGNNDVDLGIQPGNLAPGQDLYNGASTTLNVAVNPLTEGVYRISCLLKFDNFPGFVGFEEGALLSVFV
jgi:hypothetical protein